MSPANRLALGGGLVALAEGSFGVFALATLGLERIVAFLLACSLATAAMTVLLWVLIERQRPGGTGTGGGETPAGPPPPPPWWPDFERAFWQHVRGNRTRV